MVGLDFEIALGVLPERQKVSDNTARSELKSVFGKTAVRRQSDLLRLIRLRVTMRPGIRCRLSSFPTHRVG